MSEIHMFPSREQAEIAALSLGFVRTNLGWQRQGYRALIDYQRGDWFLTIIRD